MSNYKKEMDREMEAHIKSKTTHVRLPYSIDVSKLQDELLAVGFKPNKSGGMSMVVGSKNWGKSSKKPGLKSMVR
jgi:hypothetical protein